MKTILIVDDTKLVRNFLSKKLQPLSGEFTVLTAENGREALEHAQAVKIDLVITDIEMPVMDGFELLAHLNNHYPQIPVFVMTAKGSPEIKEKIDAMGSLKYFEKPMNLDALLAAIRETLESSVQGTVNGISLASFLQLVNMEGKSCTLRIKSNGQVGYLYCLKGELIAAEAGDLSADAAAIEMIGWDAALIEMLKFNKQKEKEIRQPLMNLLMEGARRKDEMEAARKTAPEVSKSKSAEKTIRPEEKSDSGHEETDLSSMYQWE